MSFQFQLPSLAPTLLAQPGPTVALVDDNPDDRIMVARLLRREIPNVRVLDVPNPETLRRVLFAGDFDIVITDYDLRWSNGLEVLRDVRLRWPSRPVIMFTGTGTEEVAVEAMKSGLDDYVIKSPERLVRLATCVSLALRREKERDEAREMKGRFGRLFGAVPSGLYRTTVEGHVIEINPALAGILGVEADAILGEPFDLHIEDAHSAWVRRTTLAAEGRLRRFSFRIRRPDGTERWLEEDASIVRPHGGEPYCEGSIQDVTERRTIEQSLLALQKAVETLPIGVTVSDGEGIIVFANPAQERMHGYAAGELIGRPVSDLVPPSFSRVTATDEVVRLRPWKRERPSLRRDGTSFPAQLMSDAVRSADGSLIGVVTTCEDISERKLTEEQLIRNAMYDELTGLANRALFRERLTNSLHSSRRKPEERFAVLFIDLDGFKLVNDSLGHGVGDEVLRVAGQRLAQTLRPGDTVARLGGDEFAILLEGLAGTEDAMLIAERCRASLEPAFELSQRSFFVGASIGIAMSDSRYREADELLRDADTAMYRAKANGRMRCEVFEPAMRTDAIRRLGADADLRRGVEQGQIEVHFQPIVHARTGVVKAVEALCRWRHPERGLVTAASFIPLAEETGLIAVLDALVLRQACHDVALWNRERDERLTVNANLSALQFHRRDLESLVERTLADSGLDPALLQLELTETAVVVDVEGSARILRRLREMGIRVCIDDFGTGQASLASLRNFPVTGLKIDRAFISGLGDEGPNEAIVRAILTLGHSLGLAVTAEGVEQRSQATWLADAKCDLLQGYLLGRPQRQLSTTVPSI